jgi:glycosyltransferase involved in cell wall biosynthesis
MRIAMFSWESLHSIAVGGVAAHVTELSAALQRKGHEVHVFTRPGYGTSSIGPRDGVWYHYCGFDLCRDFVDEIMNQCRSFVYHFFQTEDYIGHFDVVHSHDWLAAKAMSWIKRGRPDHLGIFTMHSTEFGRCGNVFFDGESARIREIEREATYSADRVIAVSGALKREMMWMYNLPDWKCWVIHNGVPMHHYEGWINPEYVKCRYSIGPTDPTVLFSGRLSKQKGPDLLLESIPWLLKYYPRAKFIFSGDGGMRSALEWRAGQLGIGHAVRFLGYRNGQELTDLYKAVDAVCVPSRNEPFGISILEAWSAGKPAIATQNGGPGEFIWHNVNGLLIWPQVDSIGWGIGTLFTDFEWARWMGRNGRIAVETAFSWDRIADRTVQCYYA